MPDEDKNFGGSLVLDFREWYCNMKMVYRVQRSVFYRFRYGHNDFKVILFYNKKSIFFSPLLKQMIAFQFSYMPTVKLEN